MKNWICLSKEGEDPFIEKFAQGCGVKPTDSDKFVYEDSSDPIVLRGILKKKIIKRCWEENRTFYYMDTGYFGNEISSKNPHGWKYWHRIVKNSYHQKLRRDKLLKLFRKNLQNIVLSLEVPKAY